MALPTKMNAENRKTLKNLKIFKRKIFINITLELEINEFSLISVVPYNDPNQGNID